MKHDQNQYAIYFRDKQDFEFRKHRLDKKDVIEMIDSLKFDNEGKILSKENDESIYKSIYKEIELINGFTQYSIE
ncbi:unnamed protein product [Didymodactylos carnosus]|uniref:Uncharacterized protein n=1 Tax=Didymodactylos carnosus TaxID=1234261 RepID=A0A8S2V0I3_9BILA|nr:unnamed protein product [Didymodactylos carnosus]CAF4364555.1 unnamed protein product [Didymodactylos carnosus]